MGTISKQARRELVAAVRGRYTEASPDDKGRILDEFVALTGYHRKHAIRVLSGTEVQASSRAPRDPVYDEAVREAIGVLWEASDRVCSKRLKALLPALLASLERHGHLSLDQTVRKRVLTASAATIDRLLQSRREAAGQQRRRAQRPKVSKLIPVRTFADWSEPEVGYAEIDLVAHGGDRADGSFVYTLVLVDVASGWTECVPLLVRDSCLVVDALERLRTTMPLPLKGIDSDNGSEFINDALMSFCAHHGIEFTRSRPYRKNDQAWVEQKNGSVVRRLVGHGRLEGLQGAQALERLYAASRLFVNFFQPSFKLIDKERHGAQVRKRYEAPRTPTDRLLTAGEVSDATKEKLAAVMATLDPLRLLDEIRAMQRHIASLQRGEKSYVLPHRDVDLDRFLRELSRAWKDGEARATHRRAKRPERNWRTRKDPFEAVWPRVVIWLETEPQRNAKELLERLRREGEEFTDGHLRTLQRRVKDWRLQAARRLIFAAAKTEEPVRNP